MVGQLIFGGISLVVLVGMIGFQMLGRRYAALHPLRDKETTGVGATTIEAAVFALLGLLVAFSFSGAETRLQARRELIVTEANAIGTAYLRLELLPEADRPPVKEEMRQYVDARMSYYKHLLDFSTARAAHARAADLQRQIWAGAIAAARHAPDSRVAIVVLPALNQMFDVTTSRDAALRTHIPVMIFLFLGALSLAAGFLAGMEMGRPERLSALHIFAFAGMMALMTYVLLNLEFPRLGFVRLDYLDSLLAELRATMT
jgi:hypothetical protein